MKLRLYLPDGPKVKFSGRCLCGVDGPCVLYGTDMYDKNEWRCTELVTRTLSDGCPYLPLEVEE